MWKRENKKGATLLETIIILTVLTVIILAVTSLSLVGIKAWSNIDKEARLAQSGSLLLERLVRELRGLDSITSAEADELIVRSKDGELKYHFEGKELIKQGGGKNISLANNLSHFQFSYYDGVNNLLSFPAAPGDIAFIRITLTLKDEKDSLSLTSGINPRNMWIKRGLP
ncbi:MAG: hypothetical protein Q7I94_06295 [Candidatus Contubernalis sp.]|nr:hypothetical protein [Candidatus Contubernalis sp.]